MTAALFYIYAYYVTHNTRMIKRDYPHDDAKNIEDMEIFKKEVRHDR